MLWYEYRQNNSGGRFCGPAITVCVQASTEKIAEIIAEKLGVYFDGCSTGQDCSCCGDRWYPSWGGEENKPNPRGSTLNHGVIETIFVYDDGKSIDFIGVPAKVDTNKIKTLLIEG